MAHILALGRGRGVSLPPATPRGVAGSLHLQNPVALQSVEQLHLQVLRYTSAGNVHNFGLKEWPVGGLGCLRVSDHDSLNPQTFAMKSNQSILQGIKSIREESTV